MSKNTYQFQFNNELKSPFLILSDNHWHVTEITFPSSIAKQKAKTYNFLATVCKKNDYYLFILDITRPARQAMFLPNISYIFG